MNTSAATVTPTTTSADTSQLETRSYELTRKCCLGMDSELAIAGFLVSLS